MDTREQGTQGILELFVRKRRTSDFHPFGLREKSPNAWHDHEAIIVSMREAVFFQLEVSVALTLES